MSKVEYHQRAQAVYKELEQIAHNNRNQVVGEMERLTVAEKCNAALLNSSNFFTQMATALSMRDEIDREERKMEVEERNSCVQIGYPDDKMC